MPSGNLRYSAKGRRGCVVLLHDSAVKPGSQPPWQMQSPVGAIERIIIIKNEHVSVSKGAEDFILYSVHIHMCGKPSHPKYNSCISIR